MAEQLAVISAFDWAIERLVSLPSQSTQSQYMLVVARLKKQNRNPGDGIRSRNTRSMERSACRFYAATKILATYRTNPEDAENIYQWILQINAKALNDQLQSTLRMNLAFENNQKQSVIQVRKSKRRSLVGLKSDWRQTLLATVVGSKYAKQIQLMMVCGCRPAEMAKIILVERLDGVCRITIRGAKISDLTHGGQDERVIDIADDHPLLLGLEPGEYQASIRGIENAVEHFALKLWPFRKESVSAYTLRHAVATDFKSSRLSITEIAAALGHQSTATMSHYGTSNRTSGGLRLVRVTATNVVRTPKIKSKYMKETPKTSRNSAV